MQIMRVSLRQQAIERIRHAIENEELTPGQQITEIGLSRSLCVAQSTVREALIELEHQGFIERLGPRNTRITVLTRRHLDEIYAVRRALEHLVVEVLADSGKALPAACRSAQEEMARTARAGSANRFYAADLQFHRELWRDTGNACLADALERIVPRLFAFGIIRHHHPQRHKLLDLAEIYGSLLQLISSGQKAAACKLMDESMDRAWTEDAQLL
jgi:DNA-binding GntR family transcriptional regulator